MFSKKCVRCCSFVFILLILLGSHWSLAVEKKLITRCTPPTVSGTFTYFVGTTRILNENIPDISITIRSTVGSVLNVRILEKREADIVSSDTKTTWEAAQGRGSFEGGPFTDLRLLYVSMTNPIQFVVSEKSGIKDIYGLEGKPFSGGSVGSATEVTAAEIFRALGVHPKIRPLSMADSIDAMKDERIVCFAKHGVPDATILDIASAMKIRIISFSDDDIEKIVRNVVGQRKTVVPPGMYPGVGEFKTVENEFADFVRKDFSAELAYKIVKTIWENRAEIKGINKMFLGDRFPGISLEVKTNYMHPGAIKFFSELGLTVPKNLIPPEMGGK